MAEYLQKLPLYQQDSHGKHINLRQSGINKGLLFERWFGGYDENWCADKKLTENNSSTHPLTWLTGFCGDKNVLLQARNRLSDLINHLKGTALTASLDWHMVTGTGEAHPLENGFRWHYGLAVPYLPASSIKGMLRTWLTCWDTDSFSKEEIIHLLGNEQESETAQIGNLLVFDAIPCEQPVLSLDVMAPHCGDWYQKGGSNPGTAETVPADWQSPNLITFLVVKKASFFFSVAARTPKAQQLLPKVMIALSEALSTLGIGAKTALGYGVMITEPEESSHSGIKLLDAAKKRREDALKKQIMASLPPNQLKILQLTNELVEYDKYNETQANKEKESKNSEIAELVNKALEEQWDVADRQALVTMIKKHSRWLHIANKVKLRERKLSIARLEEV